jgi:hypothetical protein
LRNRLISPTTSLLEHPYSSPAPAARLTDKRSEKAVKFGCFRRDLGLSAGLERRKNRLYVPMRMIEMSLRHSVLLAVRIVLLSSAVVASAQNSVPQPAVECTGWHALCSMATGCKINGKTADCNCWKVTERHIVVTAGIKDDTFGSDVKEQTQSICTLKHPCGLDEAPVCGAIKELLLSGKWVSTFSYRGWCKNWKPVACQGNNAGPWADCMTSPCSEDPAPPNIQQPLNCQCTEHDGKFVGTNGSCNSPVGTCMSTISMYFWDFDNGEFPAWMAMPGNESVKESCSSLNSDLQQ